MPAAMLAPGATIGILGGGQLGRMTALAAARLGFRCHVFATETDSPAEQICGRATVAEYGDCEALDRFAAAIDVATFEFENIPAEAVRRVAASKPVLPRPEILEITQDRLREKDFLRAIEHPDNGLPGNFRCDGAGAGNARFRLSRGAQKRPHGL